MHKRALSDIVTTILVILIAMASVVIIWNVLQPFLKNSGIDSQKYTARIDIPEESISLDPNENILSLNIERKPGQGDIAGFIFGLEDPSGLVKTFRQNMTLYEYENRNFQVNYSEFPMDDVVSITITPIFRKNQTNEEIYGIPITQPVKNKTFKIPSSLIAYWKFDEAAGATTFTDSEGDYDATLSPISTGIIAGQQGLKNSNSIYVPGNGLRYLTVSSSTNMPQFNDFTIVAWIKPEQLITYPSINQIITKADASNGLRFEYVGGTNQLKFATLSASNTYQTLFPTSPVSSSWTQVVGIYSQNEMKVYLNGVEQNSNSNLVFAYSTAQIQIGRGFKGNIDNVMIFDEALTPSQVSSLYNLQK